MDKLEVKPVEILRPIYPAIFSSIIRLLAEEQGKTFEQVLAEIGEN